MIPHPSPSESLVLDYVMGHGYFLHMDGDYFPINLYNLYNVLAESKAIIVCHLLKISNYGIAIQRKSLSWDLVFKNFLAFIRCFLLFLKYFLVLKAVENLGVSYVKGAEPYQSKLESEIRRLKFSFRVSKSGKEMFFSLYIFI